LKFIRSKGILRVYFLISLNSARLCFYVRFCSKENSYFVLLEAFVGSVDKEKSSFSIGNSLQAILLSYRLYAKLSYSTFPELRITEPLTDSA
jgi:hypothetical protein